MNMTCEKVTNIILNPVSIGFDPTRLAGDMRAVWDNRMARTLWLAFRQGYLADQHFVSSILNMERNLRRWPPNGHGTDWLQHILINSQVNSYYYNDLRGGQFYRPDEFWPELLLYVKGEREIEWTLPKEPRPPELPVRERLSELRALAKRKKGEHMIMEKSLAFVTEEWLKQVRGEAQALMPHIPGTCNPRCSEDGGSDLAPRQLAGRLLVALDYIEKLKYEAQGD